MLLYLIRHGESIANRDRCHGSWMQVPLSPAGMEQAKQAGEKLKDTPFDRVFASDLKRAMQTCEIAMPGRAYETSSLLREINCGRLDGKTRDECRAEYGDLYTGSLERQDYTPFGGENRDMLQKRVSGFLKQLELADADTVAVFGHFGTLRSVAELVLQVPSLKGRLLCPNGCISIFEFRDGVWRLNAWNI